MKIGVMSDSHDNLVNIARAVNKFNEEQVKLVLHAGDLVSPFTAQELKKLIPKFVAVFGNNDGDRMMLRHRFNSLGEFYERKYETVLAGKKIVLVHEPDFMSALIHSGEYDIIIYGHTHQVELKYEVVNNKKVLILNPGETGGWLSGKASVVIVNIEDLQARVWDI